MEGWSWVEEGRDRGGGAVDFASVFPSMHSSLRDGAMYCETSMFIAQISIWIPSYTLLITP